MCPPISNKLPNITLTILFGRHFGSRQNCLNLALIRFCGDIRPFNLNEKLLSKD
jgi:hypothetical protein